jgi:hypothetical protein
MRIKERKDRGLNLMKSTSEKYQKSIKYHQHDKSIPDIKDDPLGHKNSLIITILNSR